MKLGISLAIEQKPCIIRIIMHPITKSILKSLISGWNKSLNYSLQRCNVFGKFGFNFNLSIMNREYLALAWTGDMYFRR